MNALLLPRFFDRSALVVGRELLGKFLVRRRRGREVALPVTELEVYDGFKDRASHAFWGKTARNQVMFGDAGHLYVYLVYGMHWMLNVTVGPSGYPAAILIRGAGDIRGPGKLTATLGIDKRQNGTSALPASGLWFEYRGVRVPDELVEKTARIGISYAGNVWAKKPYRFLLKERDQ